MGLHGEIIEPDRRLWSLKSTHPGSLHMLRCKGCGHLAPMPVEQIIKRFGMQMPLSFVLPKLKCGSCSGRSVDVMLMMLCQPGCMRNRM